MRLTECRFGSVLVFVCKKKNRLSLRLAEFGSRCYKPNCFRTGVRLGPRTHVVVPACTAFLAPLSVQCSC